jgi:hypothetical protein
LFLAEQRKGTINVLVSNPHNVTLQKCQNIFKKNNNLPKVSLSILYTAPSFFILWVVVVIVLTKLLFVQVLGRLAVIMYLEDRAQAREANLECIMLLVSYSAEEKTMTKQKCHTCISHYFSRDFFYREK